MGRKEHEAHHKAQVENKIAEIRPLVLESRHARIALAKMIVESLDDIDNFACTMFTAPAALLRDPEVRAALEGDPMFMRMVKNGADSLDRAAAVLEAADMIRAALVVSVDTTYEKHRAAWAERVAADALAEAKSGH